MFSLSVKQVVKRAKLLIKTFLQAPNSTKNHKPARLNNPWQTIFMCFWTLRNKENPEIKIQSIDRPFRPKRKQVVVEYL